MKNAPFSPIVNAAGPSTRFSGAPLGQEVVNAMGEAAQQCFRVEELQEAASAYLTAATGAEAGMVTAGAAAGLVASAAACIARYDVSIMDRLPDTEGLANEIVIQRSHVTAYSRCLRQSGAKLIEVGYQGYPTQGITWPWQIEAAIGERTAALAYSAGNSLGEVGLAAMSKIAQRHQLPLIVDAAGAIKTPDDLRRPIQEGADLVAFSGGKALRGPQASGILVGKRDLIDSALLQHLDLDVREETWIWRERFLQSGILAGIPNHGICRACKVGKEQVAGLLAALARFTSEPPSVDRQTQRLQAIAQRVPSTCCTVEFVDPSSGPRPYPTLLISPTPQAALKDARQLIMALESGRPPIAVSHNFLDRNAVGIVGFCLADADVDIVVNRLVQTLSFQ